MGHDTDGVPVIDWGDELAKAALVQAWLACAVMPWAIPVAQLIAFGQTDPGKTWRAGWAWLSMAESYAGAGRELEAAVRGLGDDQWCGEDRTAFDELVQDLRTQLAAATLVCSFIGVMIVALAVLTCALILLMWVCATILDAFALAILVALCVAPPALKVLVPLSQATVFELAALLGACDTAVGLFAVGAGSAIIGALALDVTVNLATGNDAVLDDLGQAVSDGVDNVLRGYLSALESVVSNLVPKGILDALNENPVLTDPLTNPDKVTDRNG